MLGKARTGSGKTLGFGLPLLTRLSQMDKPKPRKPLSIILVPTRELAMQVGDALEPYAHSLELSIRLVAGGLSMSKQIVALERGVHLVVATPGRLADLMRRGHADLSEVVISVLDEADHMAEMGFGEEIAEILSHTPDDGQRLLFSATLDGVVDDLVTRFMHSPVLHDVTSGSDEPTSRHVVLAIPPHEKYQTATRIAAREGRTICFVRTKLAADRVAAEMRDAGVLAVALHGDRSQYERNLAMAEFRAGRLPVLVATDVAARGIHVDAVDLVLQIDPPTDYRDYTHRSGRTGRAGADGLAVTMVLPHQRGSFRRVLEKAGIDAEEATFRVIDSAALEQIAELTGAQEPSGIPVDEPVGPPRQDRRGGRGGFGDRGGRGAPRRPRDDGRYGEHHDRPRGDRPIRDRDKDRGFGDRPMRDSNFRPAGRGFGDRGGYAERDFGARRPAFADDSRIRERETALEARERELAERERKIAEREAASQGSQERGYRDSGRPARTEYRSNGREDSRGGRPYQGRGYEDRSGAGRSGGRDGFRDGGRDGGRAGGRDGGRPASRDGGRPASRDGGARQYGSGRPFEQRSWESRPYEARDSRDARGSWKDRDGGDSRGSRDERGFRDDRGNRDERRPGGSGEGQRSFDSAPGRDKPRHKKSATGDKAPFAKKSFDKGPSKSGPKKPFGKSGGSKGGKGKPKSY